MISIILGTGFGDEGKGNYVNHLCKNTPEKTIVIRFSGGHQAGHTVLHEGKRHVFSSFGSGTLRGVPTFWSKYCTVYPIGFNIEFDALVELEVDPIIYIDPMCPVTTPFDIVENRILEDNRAGKNHGSVGLGVGQTFFRHETLDHSYRIFAKDLKYPWILKNKLQLLSGYYNAYNKETIDDFMLECELFSRRIMIASDREMFNDSNKHFIFEGSQGILLDREHGLFPHVTRSHTTSKNAIQMICDNNLSHVCIDLYYMSRCYSTRHGAGPFYNDTIRVDNHDETNVTGRYQGEFKLAPFSMMHHNYAIESDRVYHGHLETYSRSVITCMDQVFDVPVYNDDHTDYQVMKKTDFKSMVSERTLADNIIFVNKPEW